MRAAIGLLALCLSVLVGCSSGRLTTPDRPDNSDRVIDWPGDWTEFVGRRVTLEGTAANAKLGALLSGGSNTIWLDLNAWPDAVFSDCGTPRLRVTGIVIARDDVPVFVEQPGEPPRAGVMVRTEEEAARARRRYLLKEATWTAVE